MNNPVKSNLFLIKPRYYLTHLGYGWFLILDCLYCQIHIPLQMKKFIPYFFYFCVCLDNNERKNEPYQARRKER